MRMPPRRFCYCLLALLLLPVMAFGQTAVSCEECSHYVSVRKGEGGFVAQVDGDAEEVIWVDSCGGVTRSGSLEPNEDGVVAGLYEACSAEGGELQLGPVTDGGWFWITDGLNSGTGNLVAMDILDNDTTSITDAGDGVETEVGKGAVWLRETATGRVGILPNILPEAPAAPAEVCGPRRNPSPPHAWDRQRTTDCVLGAGRTRIRVVGPDATGNMVEYTNGIVYRPASGEIRYFVDIWLDESGGSFSTATDGAGGAPSAASIQRGWLGKASGVQTLGSETNQLYAAWADGDVSFDRGPGGRVQVPRSATNRRDGIGWQFFSILDDPDQWGRAFLLIGPDSDYCSTTANHTAVLVLTPSRQNEFGTARNNIHPPFATGKAAGPDVPDDKLGHLRLRVVCPPSQP